MSHLYLLGVASLTLTSAGFAGSDMNADLQTRLEAAEARIAELSADQNQNWLNDERSDAVRSLVQDVLADADTRASLQGATGGAGYDGGFTIASGDGNWSMTINGGVWTSWTSVDDDTTGGAGDTDGGFGAPDPWMHLSGTIAGDWSWDWRSDPSSTDGTGWANATWNWSDGWDVTMGTFNLHENRRTQISAVNQMLIGHNRNSNVENGISVAGSWDDTRLWVEFTNGGAGAPGTGNDGDYNTNFRYEYMAEGNWGQFDGFTSADGGAAGTLIGVGYRTLANSVVGGTDGDAWWNVDVQMQFGGYGLYASYTDFSDDSNSAGDTETTSFMGSYYLNSDWEVYVAYNDESSNTANDDGNTTAIGVNNYWAGQNAKWTTQYTTDGTNDTGDVDTISTQLQFSF